MGLDCRPAISPRSNRHRSHVRTNQQFDAWFGMTAKMGRLDGILKDAPCNPGVSRPGLQPADTAVLTGGSACPALKPATAGRPDFSCCSLRPTADCFLDPPYPCLRRTAAGRPESDSCVSLRAFSATTLPRDTTARRSGRRRSASIGWPASSTTRLASDPGVSP